MISDRKLFQKEKPYIAVGISTNPDETDEPFVIDKIIKYPHQWVHITNKGKEDIQCNQ